ncbi:methyl-accepting chemotaxis protein [Pigmentibacter sp. JX0631]|uniref:methyl-accepting chemotaxis protein n=1 Tax=Pigmentibacter sp. JX0631 TaxID=2976982 RepID=UPI0024693CEA|nr:methyl-accepting chemotaxis protein [Pigmentibacter sp. JX0631]WGL59318.1 methyl-accepting chemotaxis protein [Pigmentibacter sp. JX0631]
MKKRSLSFKLNVSVLVLLTLILFSAIYASLMINKTQKFAQDTGTNWMPSILSSSKMSEGMSKYSRRIIGLLSNTMIYSGDEGAKVFEDDLKALHKYGKAIEDNLESHKKLADSDEEQKLLKNILEKWDVYQKACLKAIEINKAGDKPASVKFILKEARKDAAEFEEAIVELGKFNYKNGVHSTELGASLTSLTLITMSIVIALSVIIGLFIMNLIRTTSNALNLAIDNLKNQSIAASEIANSLKEGSNVLSDSVSEQAAAIHETSAAINEITSMVNRTAENAKESSSVATAASEKTETAQKTMQRLVTAMETIQESNAQLQNIAEIIAQINTKTAVINDIVSKTELLSLNASIESARAGEYGKGFAVVAEEVGNLAKISGKSAQDIQELITSSQEQVNKILGLTKERVDEGKKVTAEAKESFHQISEDISTMSNVIQQISEATREQEIGVRQISTAMANIDKATQKSQMAVANTKESSINLVSQSEKLDSTAKNVETLIKGSA